MIVIQVLLTVIVLSLFVIICQLSSIRYYAKDAEGDIYLMRKTLDELTDKIEADGWCRK